MLRRRTRSGADVEPSGGRSGGTWQCSTSSGRTWMTDFGPPRTPNRSSSSMASRAACKHPSILSDHEPLFLLKSVRLIWIYTNTDLYYLSHPYRTAIELRDSQVGFVASLPHPIILHRWKKQKTYRCDQRFVDCLWSNSQNYTYRFKYVHTVIKIC